MITRHKKFEITLEVHQGKAALQKRGEPQSVPDLNCEAQYVGT